MTKKPRHGVRTPLRVAGVLWGLMLGPPALADLAGVSGSFVVVDIRAASDVATTAAARDTDPTLQMMGATLAIGTRLTWIGKDCAGRPDPMATGAPKVDRNLADLRAVIGEDHRLDQSWIIDCLGRAVTDIWQVLAVDDRVLVARTSPNITYLVLEKPLSREQGLQLEDGLRQAGFDPGPVDGVIDAVTRSAVAAFVSRQTGVAANAGVITRSVVDALAR
jgi:hypothetical protein